jgi:lysophospholipid acyltransferase (LPLAT)-like uncharacterized protein
MFAGPARAAYALLRRSVRLRVDDPEGLLAHARGRGPLLFACRHGQLLPLLWATERCRLTLLISQSPDGEILARTIGPQGFRLIRGSSTQEGRAAARQVLRELQEGRAVGLAVDGPRGPRGMVQDGVLRLARSAGVPIVPLVAIGGRAWVAPRSWDRFEVPWPGSRVTVRVGPEIVVEQGAMALEHAGARLALALGGWRATTAAARGVPVRRFPFSYGHR